MSGRWPQIPFVNQRALQVGKRKLQEAISREILDEHSRCRLHGREISSHYP